MYHDDENEEKLPIVKFLDGFKGGACFIIFLIIFSLCIFFAPSERKNQLPVKPSETRAMKVNLLPGEGQILLPTDEYLKKLEGVCKSSEERRCECDWRLGQIKEGRDDVMSRINPIYGRPPFTTEQIAYIRQSESRIMQLLQGFE